MEEVRQMVALADMVTALPWLKPDGFLCEAEGRWTKQGVQMGDLNHPEDTGAVMAIPL